MAEAALLDFQLAEILAGACVGALATCSLVFCVLVARKYLRK